MALDAAMLAEMKRLWTTSHLTQVEIAKQFGCSAARVSQLAKQGEWGPRPYAGNRGRQYATFPRVSSRAGIARRMCAVINRKLDQMETDMQSGELSSADLERDAKTVASMIGGMEKVASDADDDRTHKSVAALTASVNEVERLQREIIERFERIQRRRDAERGFA